jgi:hypothetical protein
MFEWIFRIFLNELGLAKLLQVPRLYFERLGMAPGIEIHILFFSRLRVHV